MNSFYVVAILQMKQQVTGNVYHVSQFWVTHTLDPKIDKVLNDGHNIPSFIY